MKTLDLVIKEKTVEQFKIPVNAVIEKELQAKYMMNIDALKFATEVIKDEIDDNELDNCLTAISEINYILYRWRTNLSIDKSKETVKSIANILLTSFR